MGKAYSTVGKSHVSKSHSKIEADLSRIWAISDKDDQYPRSKGFRGSTQGIIITDHLKWSSRRFVPQHQIKRRKGRKEKKEIGGWTKMTVRKTDWKAGERAFFKVCLGLIKNTGC